MILLCGIPSEPPLAMVRENLIALDLPHAIFNQRHFGTTELEFEITAGQVTGTIRLEGQSYHLENFAGVYSRLMDDQFLPELKNVPPDTTMRYQCRSLHDTLVRWCEIAPCRVVNRIGPMGSNFSKPYQSQLIAQQGFSVPETLITNDPEKVREFQKRHHRVIYKSMSGVRSIVQILNDQDLTNLDRIRWCPTQFQEFVEGTNVRVHTVGQQVFATAILSDATDYRYAHLQTDGNVELRAMELSSELSERCIRLSESLQLAFAGIDLKITSDNEIYCFEVNPCPAFSYYEANTGQPISEAVARYLSGNN